MTRLQEILLEILPMTEMELKMHCYGKLRNYYSDTQIFFGDGYLCASGTQPVGLVAHMDVSGVRPPKKDEVLCSDKYVKALNSIVGGDDRNGVAMILMSLEDGFKPTIIFTEGEEIGCVGANKLVKDFESIDVKYLVQIDRRSDGTGFDNCVFYDCGNTKFKNYVTDTFNFIEQYGSFSDISVISPAYDIASVNVSCGYYFEHTNMEYIDLEVFERVYSKVCQMIEDIDNVPKFDFQEVIWGGYTHHNNSCNSDPTTVLVDGKYLTIEEYYEKFFGEEEEEVSSEITPIF